MFLSDKSLNPGVIEAKPFTLEHFTNWLERQQPEQTYNWHDCRGFCLLSQYHKAQGGDGRFNKAHFAFVAAMGKAPGYERCTYASFIAMREPHTFGAALERARKLMEAKS